MQPSTSENILSSYTDELIDIIGRDKQVNGDSSLVDNGKN